LNEEQKKKYYDELKIFSEKLRSVVDNGNEIAIISHLDADGIISGSIIATALARLGGKYTVRVVSDLNSSLIERIKAEKHECYLFTDLGAGWASQLQNSLENRWLVIDHHQIPEEEILTDDACRILNVWKYGIDGGKEVSAGGMAYMVASRLNRKNENLSSMAVVSAVADRQDQGDKRSFVGLNAEISKGAQLLGLVSVELDLMLSGRETRPLHNALAYTSFPYINGLTWNGENCYALLKSAGIKLKHNGRWRVPIEFTQEEKSAILDAIAKFLANSSKISAGVLDDLIGYVYTLTEEDKRSHLRDAREFSTMLNACGRIGKAGIGVSVCMGDRNTMLSLGEDIIGAYNTTLRNYVSTILADKWRLVDDGKIVFVSGDGLLTEDMLGAVSSLLSGSLALSGKLLLVRTLGKDDMYRISSRKCIGCISRANLGLIMRHCAEACGGAGGGHSAAAECRIPLHALENFMVSIKAASGNLKFEALS